LCIHVELYIPETWSIFSY